MEAVRPGSAVRREPHTCPVCFREFDQHCCLPCTLPCQHTFCHECLLHPSLAPGGRVRCPLCRSLSWTHSTLIRKTAGHLWGGPVRLQPMEEEVEEEGGTLSSDPSPSPGEIPSPPLLVSGLSLAVGVQNSPDLRCPLCSQHLHLTPGWPRTLDCTHTLCEGCLTRLLSSSPGRWVRFLYCPACSGQSAVFLQSRAPPPLLGVWDHILPPSSPGLDPARIDAPGNITRPEPGARGDSQDTAESPCCRYTASCVLL
ncbi:RING finger protein 223-like [Acipenser ruthenus]|uniref:RING finger protein 223-like n=1 Tax=Acipenser ruthenus TaxID=7906 RepID=UPI0027410CD5|nr:RING finger protein 223-like [Acipenser ruthenus]